MIWTFGEEGKHFDYARWHKSNNNPIGGAIDRLTSLRMVAWRNAEVKSGT